MGRKSKHDQERGYARSAWDERLDLEDEFKGSVFVTLTPEPRVGVWKLRLTFTQLLTFGDQVPIQCSIAVLWPNAHEQMFVGALWDAMIKLRAMVEEMAGVIHPAPRTGG